MATTAPMEDTEPKEQEIHPGALPAWGQADIPAPPPFSFKNAVRLFGPAAIALGMSIGSGEWLLGPAVTAKYGAALLWVATVSIILQTILNQEMIRYTLATGEPIFTGFMRSKPGPGFWGPVYGILFFLQIGWPGWALAAATAVTSIHLGRLPTDADKGEVILWGTLTFIVCLVIIAMGKKVEKTLERAEWFMIACIIGFLLIVGLFAVEASTWGRVFMGFLGLRVAEGGITFGGIPQGSDWMLLASFAAYAGMGGLGNGTLTNWVRDKGWGMAARCGYISGIAGGELVHVSRVGCMFPRTAENIGRFREWLRYTHFEQLLVFCFGCFLGMGLPALMTVQFVPAGTDITGGWAAASYQANGIGQVFGSLAWTLTLLNGFWILFSTQLGNTDAFARTATDIAWSASPKVRTWAREDIRKVYYAILIAFALFGMWAIRAAQPFTLIIIGAFIAAFNFVILGAHVLYVQKRFLPKELRMPAWREAAIYLFILMFTIFCVMGIYSRLPDISNALGIG